MKCSAVGGSLSVVLSGSGIATSLYRYWIACWSFISRYWWPLWCDKGGDWSLLNDSLQSWERKLTVSVCKAKINSVKDIVSKALADNKISHEVFLLNDSSRV